MAKLIDGKTLELEKNVKEVVDATEAKPVVETKEITVDAGDLTKIIENYVDYFAAYIKNNQNVPNVYEFDEEMVKPYCPFICFNYRLDTMVRNLLKEEYIKILKQTDPKLGELLEKTDLKEALPKKIDIYDDNSFRGALETVGLLYPLARRNIKSLVIASRHLKFIPDLEFLSLFMQTGKDFRNYLEVTKPRKLEMSLFCAIQERENEIERTEECIPKASYLFSPDNLLKYINNTGSGEVRQMMKEYENITNFLKGKKNINRLYERLKKANPQLTI